MTSNQWRVSYNSYLKVGHSIGSYISMEILRKCPEKVNLLSFDGLQPIVSHNAFNLKRQAPDFFGFARSHIVSDYIHF